MHFRVHDPGGSVPRRGIECRPKVKEEDGRDTGRRNAISRVVRRVGHLDVSSDDPHADSAAQGAEHEQISSSKVVDHVEQPEYGENRLHHAKEARREEASVRSRDTQTREHRRRIVVDSIYARTILPKEKHYGCSMVSKHNCLTGSRSQMLRGYTYCYQGRIATAPSLS